MKLDMMQVPKFSILILGGLMREFFNLMVKRLFNPDSGLFRLTDNKKSLDLNPESYIVPRHLQYLELAGFVLAKVNNKQLIIS